MKNFTQAWDALQQALEPKLTALVPNLREVKRTAILPIDSRRPIADVVPFCHLLMAPEARSLSPQSGQLAPRGVERVQALVVIAVPAPVGDSTGVEIVELMEQVRSKVAEAASEISQGSERAWQWGASVDLEVFGLTEDGSAFVTFFLTNGQCAVL
jgi:hypothetical protein